jgi:hypothetical protein
MGCGKCGTTSLAYVLDMHPEVSLSRPKEPNFFSSDAEFAKGVDYYSSLFLRKPRTKTYLDASVSYTLLSTELKVVDRIMQSCKKPKFIYIARNPFKRIESVFCEAHHHTHISNIDMPYDLKSGIKYHLPMLFNSLYWHRMAEVRRYFPPANILYLTLEQFISHRIETLDKVFKFLEIEHDPVYDETSLHLNMSAFKTYEPPLLRAIRKVCQRVPVIQDVFVSFLERKMRKPVSELDLTWDDEMKYLVVTMFRDDVQKYLYAAGMSASFWGEEFL